MHIYAIIGKNVLLTSSSFIDLLLFQNELISYCIKPGNRWQAYGNNLPKVTYGTILYTTTFQRLGERVNIVCRGERERELTLYTGERERKRERES